MATTKNGVVIKISAFFPFEGGLDAQIAALTRVKDTHENGQYAALLADSIITAVSIVEPTRRRFADDPAQTDIEDAIADAPQADDAPPSEGENEDEDVPDFVREESTARRRRA